MMETSTQFFDQVADVEGLLAYVKASINSGIAEGAFPAVRATPAGQPTGGESAIVIYDPDRAPIAFALYYQPEGHQILWVDILWVEPKYRRKRLATKLLSDLSFIARGHKFVLQLGTMVSNEPMRALAAKMGLVEHAIVFEAA